jgi:hypothetical protein
MSLKVIGSVPWLAISKLGRSFSPDSAHFSTLFITPACSRGPSCGFASPIATALSLSMRKLSPALISPDNRSARASEGSLPWNSLVPSMKFGPPVI